MIKQLIASSLLAINVGIQNTLTDTTKYQSWQATNAQKIVNEDNNYIMYCRYIAPTQKIDNDIIEIRQNSLYEYVGRPTGHGAGLETHIYIITDVNPDITINGNYNIQIEMTLNDSWYNIAWPSCDAYRKMYEIDYTNLNTTEKANLEDLLLDNNWQTIVESTWTAKKSALSDICNAGTTNENTSSIGNTIAALQQTYHYASFGDDFNQGRKVYITQYQIVWTSLYTNIDPQTLQDIYDPLLFTPTASANNLEWEATAQTGEIVDIPGIMFTMLGMPFAFVAQAFDLTIFPGTQYQVNLSHIFLAIAGAAILLFIIKKVIK